MRRRLSAPFLICALLALPGCGIVKDAAKRPIVRFLGGTVAAVIYGADEAAADDEESVEDRESTVAGDEGGNGGFFGNGEDSSDDAAGSGFYKVVEANGTVRFVSSLAEVPAAQRPKAKRIDSQPIGGGGDAKRRAPSRRAAQDFAAAKSEEPAAFSGGHEVVVYTTSWCGWCKKTRAWLDDQGVDYENRDVEVNAKWAEEMHDLTGSGGVPVIVIDGEVIKGFNRARLEKLLRG